MKKMIFMLMAISSLTFAEEVTIGQPENPREKEILVLTDKLKENVDKIENNEKRVDDLAALLEDLNKKIDSTKESNQDLYDVVKDPIDNLNKKMNYVPSKAGKDLGSYGKANDGILATIDDYYNIFDKGSEEAFEKVMQLGDTVTSGLSVAGSFFGMSGLAVAGNNIQAQLTRLQLVRKRLDDLKQYKRWMDNVKDLSKEDLTKLSGVNNALNKLNNILKDGSVLKEKAIDFNKLLKSTDLSKAEGWDKLLQANANMHELNNQVLNKVSGDEANKIFDLINKSKETISKINPKNSTQSVKKLNEQMDLLITVTQTLLSNQATVAGQAAIKEKEKLEKEMLENEKNKVEQEQAERLRQEYRERNKQIELGTKFAGEITGG